MTRYHAAHALVPGAPKLIPGIKAFLCGTLWGSVGPDLPASIDHPVDCPACLSILPRDEVLVIGVHPPNDVIGRLMRDADEQRGWTTVYETRPAREPFCFGCGQTMAAAIGNNHEGLGCTVIPPSSA